MNILENGGCEAVLFDLDGTLVDTAPDMVAVLQELQVSRGADAVAFDTARLHVSNGALGLLSVGFPDQDHEFGSELHLEYLDRYEARLADASSLFPGFPELLDEFDSQGCPWGVVTNKPAFLTIPLLDALELGSRLACVVSGDTLPQRKPDPAPLLHACDLASLLPETTVYVGDASRDITAGRDAGMPTIAAAYGYITPDDNALDWGADLIASSTAELAQMLRKALNVDA